MDEIESHIEKESFRSLTVSYMFESEESKPDSNKDQNNYEKISDEEEFIWIKTNTYMT